VENISTKINILNEPCGNAVPRFVSTYFKAVRILDETAQKIRSSLCYFVLPPCLHFRAPSSSHFVFLRYEYSSHDFVLRYPQPTLFLREIFYISHPHKTPDRLKNHKKNITLGKIGFRATRNHRLGYLQLVTTTLNISN
jgi:hypothetical protein